MLFLSISVLSLASTAAGDEDDAGSEQGEDGRDEHEPDTRTPPGRTETVVVDVVLDDAEGDKVANHGDYCHDKCE